MLDDDETNLFNLLPFAFDKSEADLASWRLYCLLSFRSSDLRRKRLPLASVSRPKLPVTDLSYTRGDFDVWLPRAFALSFSLIIIIGR